MGANLQLLSVFIVQKECMEIWERHNRIGITVTNQRKTKERGWGICNAGKKP